MHNLCNAEVGALLNKITKLETDKMIKRSKLQDRVLKAEKYVDRNPVIKSTLIFLR